MPLFHFRSRDGAGASDGEGTDLPGIAAARVAAARMAGQMLVHEAPAFWEAGEWEMVVTDHAGLTLFILTIVATGAPCLGTEPSLARR